MLLLLIFYTWIIASSRGCFYYPALTDYKKLGWLGNKFEYQNFWQVPAVTLENAQEEAIMLIGGKLCLQTSCELSYLRRRKSNDTKVSQPDSKTQVLPSHDRTIKFFTKYGFCRMEPESSLKLPRMSYEISGLGAVALPDGRVLICGGGYIELAAGGRFRARNSTDCWYWVQGTEEIKPLEFYSKIPFAWLGPFTPSLMKLVPIRIKKAVKKTSEEGSNQQEQGARHGGEHHGDKESSSAVSKTIIDKLTARNKKYRIMILPWPAFTDAYKSNTSTKGGNVIFGRVKSTEFGPRIIWEKQKLNDMALGNGGCYVIQNMDRNRQFYTNPPSFQSYRVHTFGGREVGVDIRGNDLGWTQDVNIVTKFPRNFDFHYNQTTQSMNLKNGGDVTRLKCRENFTAEDVDFYTLGNGAIDAEKRAQVLNAKFRIDANNEGKTVRLEQDRVFHTCHILPTTVHSKSGGRRNIEIILIGGGLDQFTDRPSLLGSELGLTPLYREIATFIIPNKEKNKTTPLENCHDPIQNGKGFWRAIDRRFGYGLNVPRTRHASEILKTKNSKTNRTEHTIWVFGGHNEEIGSLDTLESFQLGLKKLSNFKLYDEANSENSWKFRLPWPLFDITTVKIPIDWLPKKCLQSYLRKRQAERLA